MCDGFGCAKRRATPQQGSASVPKCANLSRPDVNGAAAAGLSESNTNTHAHTYITTATILRDVLYSLPELALLARCGVFYEQRRVLQVRVASAWLTLHFSCRADATRSGCLRCAHKKHKNHVREMNVRNTLLA